MITPEEIKRIKIEICLGTFSSWELNSTVLKDLDDQREFGIISCLRREGYWGRLIRYQRFETAEELVKLSDKIEMLSIKETEEIEEEFACGSAIRMAEECPELFTVSGY